LLFGERVVAVVKNALIVGGGIGGLSAAIALRRAGVEVDLVEIKSDWKVYHVGIIVQGNFVRAMEALGIADEAVAAGFPTHGLTFQDLHGHVLADIPGIKLASERYPADLGMARPALHRVLSTAAQRLGTRVRLGMSFAKIEERSDAVRVTFTDGSEREYDLVVGADGVYSAVRAALFDPDIKPHFTGQGVWRYNVRRPRELTRVFMCVGLQGGKCGFCPLTESAGYVMLVQSEPGNPKHPSSSLADIFRGRMAACTGVMAELRDQIVDSSQVVYRPLEAMFLRSPWHTGRVLLIGDAAHATTPHLGQGAAQAVEDAVVLGDVAGKHNALEPMFAEFMQRRFERCKFIFEASLQIGEWEQYPTPDADPARLTARMLRTMARPI
jgi:2-polyprenyl-6-methoxyphenol hydroxylase-like FAD-dependent oxidoreductase